MKKVIGLRGAGNRPLSKNIANIRRSIRAITEALAKTHRGCDRARGCGCPLDRTLTVLERAHEDLFSVELSIYATPMEPTDG